MKRIDHIKIKHHKFLVKFGNVLKIVVFTGFVVILEFSSLSLFSKIMIMYGLIIALKKIRQ